ncbi:MAG: phosphoribosylaminoimidazolesuccinocarboxamide synthase [Gammaproteobacteria bacterium]|nr:phosphoribosylaminoimidazolesuccinocarboxamide synthase [Gammaproteobacteria bacterium]
MSEPLFNSNLKNLPLLHRGKVRDIYSVDDRNMLIVATDRISAFDVVLPTPIPDKGTVLTAMSHFWFGRLRHIVPNHLSDISLEQVLPDAAERELLSGRSMVVRRLRPLPIEAIVRGYLVGSGWKEYRKAGTVCGISLPSGLREAERLPQTLFTPSTKAEAGAHDENISFAQTVAAIGEDLARRVREVSIALYTEAAAYALTRGIIIADTKFEFGLDDAGTLTLIDEVLTPDSSRFWPADQYRPGSNPPSFDKQYVRDYLESLDWNKRPPAPDLPVEVVARTAEKYQEALRRLTAPVRAGGSGG